MGRAGGGGSGGRSGGGGGRSSGGFSGGSRSSGGWRGSGSSGGSHRGGYAGGGSSSSGPGFGGPGRGPGYGGHRPPPPHYHRGGWGWGGGGWGYGPGRPYRRGYYGGSGCSGCLSPIIVICVVVAALLVTSLTMRFMSFSMDGVQQSTIERKPLTGVAIVQTGYYTDELDWITRDGPLVSGMAEFKQKTGVQPYVWITDNLDGNNYPTNQEFTDWSNAKYDELFEDEAHLFWLFFEHDGEYVFWYSLGMQAQTVMDDEALDIVRDYFERYYYSDLEEPEMIGTAFSEAADRMMSVTTPWYSPVLIVALVIVAVIALLVFLNKRKKLRIAEKQAAADVLNAPIDDLPPRE